MFSVKWGKMVVNRGEKIHAEDFGVIPPPLVVKRGDPFAPSSAAVTLGPRTYSKKQTVCVLGMGYGRLAGASELHLRQVGARGCSLAPRNLSYSREVHVEMVFMS